MVASKIDVHAHFLPPKYREACIQNGHSKPDGMPHLPEWNEDDHLALMSEVGTSKSILSISAPGPFMIAGDKKLSAELARYCNAYAADLKKRLPDKFGFWASLPIDDVQLSLDEIEKATAEGADGFAVLTNTHGHYLGDPVFDKVFDELNRRKATLFIHPASPCIACGNGDPIRATPLSGQYPNPIMEFFFDTARAVVNMFMTGTIARCPDIKFIIPHAGGGLSPLVSRFTGFSAIIPDLGFTMTDDEARGVFGRQFYFDLAGFPFPGLVTGLQATTGVGADRLLYGSDYPFTPAPGVKGLAGKFHKGVEGRFSEEEIEKICRLNAEELLK